MFRKTLIGALAVLVLGLTSLGVGSKTASAEVIENSRHEWGRVLTNPCNGLPITLSGEFHQVWYTTPEGHTIMRYNVHYTGTDSVGTEYVFNARRVMDHSNWPRMFPFSDEQVYDVVSKGGQENFRLTLSVDYATGMPVVYVSEATCKG